jgi:NhaP-type Na+/H+ or K+/H+ antiporter
MATPSTQSQRWPLRTTILCLAIGALVGPFGFKLIEPEVREHAQIIESLSEIALAACLFCVGLRMRVPLEWRLWRVPVRLATATMLGTLIIIAAVAHIFFDLSFAQSLLLGAILAPTDPVLASDVRLGPPGPDEEQGAVRFSLAAEGALNSGMAFPAVVFSLGLLGLHDPGPLGMRWLALDLLWPVASGVALGWFAGAAAARLIMRLETNTNGESGVPEGLLVLLCAAAAYAAAIAAHAYGFLAVFAAGIALSRGGKLRFRMQTPRVARHLQRGALRVEHFAELMMVTLLGALLAMSDLRPAMFLFALVLLLAVRPLAVRMGLGRVPVPEGGRRLVEWFGIRGIASVYYLMHSINEGLPSPFARELTALTLAVLVTSIVLHSLSSSLPLVPRHLNQEG